MRLKEFARKNATDITLLVALLLVLAVPAIAFPVHMTMTPGVVISLVSGHGNISFAANRTFSSFPSPGRCSSSTGLGSA